VAVKIRLMRVGKRKQPSYRVVVADGRKPRDGRFIEIIGHYGPQRESQQVEIDGDKALAWLRQGAQPSEVVQKLLAITGVWERFVSERGGDDPAARYERARATRRARREEAEAAARAEQEAQAGDASASPNEASPETDDEASASTDEG